MYICICVYIYIERERERERDVHICNYIQTGCSHTIPGLAGLVARAALSTCFLIKFALCFKTYTDCLKP